MVKPVYVVASKMVGQRKKIDVVADNVANANTAGFKKASMGFEELISVKDTTNVASFTRDTGLNYNMTSGGLEHTGSTFDIAIQGNGFFAVEVNGQAHYTRNGSFNLDAQGNLVDMSGNFVLDTNGAPITIPQDSQNVLITNEGTLTDQNGVIADLGIFRFDNPQNLARAGKGNWALTNGEVPLLADSYTVRQGMLEMSNVSAIDETVSMTTLLRSYQSAARLMNSIEDLEQRGIRELSRLPS